MKVIVTGGAGFIGSCLVEKLLEKNHEVTIIDNLETCGDSFIKDQIDSGKVKLIKADIRELDQMKEHIKGDAVFHLAANSDVKRGAEQTNTDLNYNIIGTYNILEACRLNNVKKFAFASSSTVYGENSTKALEEMDLGELPISFYGASKLAGEALASVYSNNFNIQVWLFRFANVVGTRSTHGVVFDFYNKLKENPDSLEILGNGKQEKSYISVEDCASGIIFGFENANNTINIFNLASKDVVNVTRIAEIVSSEMKLTPKFKFTGGDRGWKGDVPKVQLSGKKLQSIGWSPKKSSEQAIREAVKYLKEK